MEWMFRLLNFNRRSNTLLAILTFNLRENEQQHCGHFKESIMACGSSTWFMRR